MVVDIPTLVLGITIGVLGFWFILGMKDFYYEECEREAKRKAREAQQNRY